LTHIHLDHAGAAGELSGLLPNARVLAHPRARLHLEDPCRLWEASLKTLGPLALQYGVIEPVPADRLQDVHEGMALELGRDTVLQFYFTPGHAPHHVSLMETSDHILVAGEAAGACINGSLRPATPPPFRLEETLASLEKLIALKPAQICYGHFGCYDEADARLSEYRDKVSLWHEILHLTQNRGLDAKRLLPVMQKHDRGLAYLEQLDADACAREVRMLENSIAGISLSS
jgi:glyoxylase-like metal-dependent hydrolase (beta-lactamase superfamily II)